METTIFLTTGEAILLSSGLALVMVFGMAFMSRWYENEVDKIEDY
jgi:hypothetical protein